MDTAFRAIASGEIATVKKLFDSTKVVTGPVLEACVDTLERTGSTAMFAFVLYILEQATSTHLRLIDNQVATSCLCKILEIVGMNCSEAVSLLCDRGADPTAGLHHLGRVSDSLNDVWPEYAAILLSKGARPEISSESGSAPTYWYDLMDSANARNHARTLFSESTSAACFPPFVYSK